jgi:predicted DNA-binding transcriptional regulator AlpA
MEQQITPEKKYLIHSTEDEFQDSLINRLKEYIASIQDVKEKPEPPPLKLYKRSEVAQIFSVDVQTVSDWVTYGELPKPVKFGSKLYFTRQQIDDEIEKRLG